MSPIPAAAHASSGRGGEPQPIKRSTKKNLLGGSPVYPSMKKPVGRLRNDGLPYEAPSVEKVARRTSVVPCAVSTQYRWDCWVFLILLHLKASNSHAPTLLRSPLLTVKLSTHSNSFSVRGHNS
ncbi:hypothetical protein BDQ17DRAFT_1336091 [Cyathus striatus]|nr:hypothetical protein BDQ17DRAFT_1336091 [Cyathus striatus]